MLVASLPRSPDELSAAWLNEALQVRHPGTSVRQVVPAQIVHGAGTKVCIDAHYAGNPAQLPGTLGENGYGELFNGSMRDDLLTGEIF